MANRRQFISTDESLFSSTSSMIENARVAEAYLRASELQNLPPDAVLSRTLSTRSVISTTSSFAIRWSIARFDTSGCIFQEIGEGLHGQIFELTGTDNVIKVAKDSTVRKEFELHKSIYVAFERYGNLSGGVQICKPRDFFALNSAKGQQFWNEQSRRFTAQRHCGPSDVLVSERVLPLPKVVRHALIDCFLSDENQDLAAALKNERTQRHALARVYLGQNTGKLNTDNNSNAPINLRNFPLYLHDMRTLGLDVVGIARAMGHAMAVMHWGAGIDGEDIEIVLGTKAMSTSSQPDFQNRKMRLFIIDFGQCSTVERSENGVHPMWGAIVANSPFCPKPEETEIWREFRTGYVISGREVCLSEGIDTHLPGEVMDGIEKFY